MTRTPHRSKRPWLVVLVALLGFAVAQTASAQAEYPAESCASAKLKAAGRLCKRAIAVRAKFIKDGDTAARDQRIAKALATLSDRWSEAEAAAAEAGGVCDESSVSSDDLRTLVDGAADAVADQVGDSTGVESPGGASCAKDLLKSAASYCKAVLIAEHRHLADPSRDPLREDLGAALKEARKSFREDWKDANRDSCDAPKRGDVKDAVDQLVGDAIQASTTTDEVGSEWTEVVPPASEEYNGRTIEPMCWDGSPYKFYARKGTVNKLVMYYMGGGACWSGDTCAGIPDPVNLPPVFNRDIPTVEQLNGFDSGFADLDNPDNPFRDWSVIFVPYCTGDVHWGDATVDYTPTLADPITVQHKGFINAQAAEKWARDHFVHPDQVFVTGSSAGAYGAVVNSLSLQEFAYPSADFAVLGDAGNGVITQDFLANDLANWGIEDNLPEWIPGLNVPLTELNAADLYTEAAAAYPQNRFGTYTTAFDGGRGGQTGFFNIMRSPFVQWLRWWDASCDWNTEMRALNQQSAAGADNFRYYVGAGSAHTMWGNDKVYTDTTGGVPTVKTWIEAMLDGNGAWTNVECVGCGVVLQGDPDPTKDGGQPPFTPFTGQDTIDCPLAP